MSMVKVGDINMYYEIHGKGEPLVMICGASATTEAYSLLVPRYSLRYKVILFDNRGAGGTDKPDISYSIPMMADDLAGLLSAIGVESAYIYGMSMGGMVAQEFAIRYPGRVKKLILLSTTCGGRHSIPLEQSKRFNRELRQKMTREELGEETLRLCVTDEYIKQHPDITGDLKNEMMRHTEPAYSLLRQAEAAREHDTCDRLHLISVPTLVIAGDADAAIAVENSRVLASKIRGAELVIFPKTGHILLEAGDEPDRLILDFLKRPASTN